MRLVSTVMAVMIWCTAFASIKVSDIQVFSGYPWKEVVVGYTIVGTDDAVDCVRLTAEDKIGNKTYVVDSVTSTELLGAKLSEGRHVMRWNAMADGVRFSSGKVLFSVSVLVSDVVQLWKGGPCWAKCNLGASQPEECGYYFWWGDTIGCKRNVSGTGWVSTADETPFNFSKGSCRTCDMDLVMLKSQGYIGASGNLVPAYDAATQLLGYSWRMPTYEEWNALIDNCTSIWTTRNGVYGRLVIGKGDYEDKHIFIPITGVGYESDLYYSTGNYWSSTPYSDSVFKTGQSRGLQISSDRVSAGGFKDRFWGMPVRPVKGFAQ